MSYIQKLNEANNEGKTKSFVAAKSHYRYVVGKIKWNVFEWATNGKNVARE